MHPQNTCTVYNEYEVFKYYKETHSLEARDEIIKTICT